jgi:hypothetical protein
MSGVEKPRRPSQRKRRKNFDMREALMRLPAAAEQTRAQRKRDKAWWTLAGPDEGISEVEKGSMWHY